MSDEFPVTAALAKPSSEELLPCSPSKSPRQSLWTTELSPAITSKDGAPLAAASLGALSRKGKIDANAERLPEVCTTTAGSSSSSVVGVPIGSTAESTNTIVCKEWQTESVITPNCIPPLATSSIPEKDAVLWVIRDFKAFRIASQVSHIPPLVSPEFGGGCRLRLSLYDKKRHISGTIELPIVKATRDGVAHFKIFVVKPDLKVLVSRKVEMRISSAADKRSLGIQRTSPTFRLTKARTFRSPKFERLIHEDTLRIRVMFEYFPFDSPVFRGFTTANLQATNSLRQYNLESLPENNDLAMEYRSELLRDIRQFCAEDVSQNVEIRGEDAVFQACRFLLCARSKRFREIFGNGCGLPGSARGSPPRFPYLSRNMAVTAHLSSVSVQDISVPALEEMLAFIHTDSCSWLNDASTDIMKVLELFEASDHFGVESLTRRLTAHLASRMNNENFVFLFEVSERCNNEEFKRLCTQYMDSIPGSQVASLMRASTIANSLPSDSPRISISV